MILFFRSQQNIIFAVQITESLNDKAMHKLKWLFDYAEPLQKEVVEGIFIGPRKEMITPWSTNAVEITQNMGIKGVVRIEQFLESPVDSPDYDPMLQAVYNNIDQSVFTLDKSPDPVVYIDDIAAFNQREGLALSPEEISYLETLRYKIGRKLTDSEIFGFSQVNSEHCRHKIFNGIFIIDGMEQEHTLFQMIKQTTAKHRNRVVSAYKDNCAFLQGPVAGQFAPERQDIPGYFNIEEFESVISLKAETHNFPTTVEPFNGAATGTGGEIRDRIAGGKAAFPVAGTAVYMTSYTRLKKERPWEQKTSPRQWLYKSPEEILIKASNGASDFGNKFGQPLICGSVLTFEHAENDIMYGYDKVIMLAGGIGYGKKKDSMKDTPAKDNVLVLLGGDNYRIGMGGGAVSSVSTGEYGNAIELNAVQRSNPEMQKRVYNAIRALGETKNNPVISIHDHGAGGHLNCYSELVEDTGGEINIEKLPVGDPTLSAKEIIGNESQERMGLVVEKKDVQTIQQIAERERAPFYVIGKITGDNHFSFTNKKNDEKPIDLDLEDLFGNPPKTILKDEIINNAFAHSTYDPTHLNDYIKELLRLESVACKDYLTNKVDRSVTGRIAFQQTTGEIQLPLNNLGVIALDYNGIKGAATAIGHAPVTGLLNAADGSILSIAEALTNIIWVPLQGRLQGVSLSANWMWPCKNKGEDSRLYKAVKAASEFATALGINIPTGKDSLSMTQKYPDGTVVRAPGTVIISAAAEVKDIRKIVGPVIVREPDTELLYINMSSDGFKTGGSAFSQITGKIGNEHPTVKDPGYFLNVFNRIQELIEEQKIRSGHDISSGGMISALLEMNFPNNTGGIRIDLSEIQENDVVNILMSETPGLIIQTNKADHIQDYLLEKGIEAFKIGEPIESRNIKILQHDTLISSFSIDELRDIWYETSYLLDKKQSGEQLALQRFRNYKKQPLSFVFPSHFDGKCASYNIQKQHARTGIQAAIIREKGVNGDREMAYSMYLAGMDVKDVHMTDLVSGRETLEDVNMIVFVGGFSNSDVLGSAKGWAGAFLHNPKAKKALDQFYKRTDTLSLGICNGCQLMIHLGVIIPGHDLQPTMHFNDTGKFESSFLNVDIMDNDSVMLKTLAGSRLGIWIAHGEGKFKVPYDENQYNIPVKYSYADFPGNPNGSDFNIAGLCSPDGRHLAMMPHLERSVLPWQWAYYPSDRKPGDEVTPWIEAFVNAKHWIEKAKKE